MGKTTSVDEYMFGEASNHQRCLFVFFLWWFLVVVLEYLIRHIIRFGIIIMIHDCEFVFLFTCLFWGCLSCVFFLLGVLLICSVLLLVSISR